MKTRIVASLVCGSALLTMTACLGSAETRRGGPTAAYDGPVVTFNDSSVAPRAVGRVLVEDNGDARFSWTGTGAELHFTGTAVSMDITDHGQTHYLAIVDGQVDPDKITPVAGRSTVPLAVGLPRGEHTVRVVRISEPLVGTSVLHGFVLGEFDEPLPAPDLELPRIEVIGDSISAGYGNEGRNEECGFSPETENGYRTYAARAGRELGAEVTTLAWSGKGVFSNRGDEQDTRTMRELWKMTLPDEEVLHDFSEPAPRAVVINLGTNDFAPEVQDTSPFAEAAAALVDDVRATYPETLILVTVGPLLTDDYPEKKQALTTVRAVWKQVVAARGEAGDARIRFLQFAPVQTKEGWGCDYHPSIRTHDRMAAELMAALRDSGAF